MDGRLRGAIAGVGNVAALGHAPAWSRCGDVQIVAACDPRPERREALAPHFPGVAWYDSLDALLARESIDFVDVCAPPSAHGAAIRQALEAGRHVLCEKPLVLDPEERTALSALSRARGLALATVHNWRYAPILARAGAWLRSGALGPVRKCRWEVRRDRPATAVAAAGDANWRLDPQVSGGGILTDHGWHAIYVLSEWLGPPRAAAAVLTSNGRPDAVNEDTAEVELRFPGATGQLFLTWRAQERANRVALEAERGTVRIDGRSLEIQRPGRPLQIEHFPQALSEGSHHADWFEGVTAAFVDEVRNPDRRGTTLAEAKTCLSVIGAARQLGAGAPALLRPAAAGSGGRP